MASSSTGRRQEENTKRENLFQAKHTLLRMEGLLSPTQRWKLSLLGIEETTEFESEDFGPESVFLLPGIRSNHNLGAESDDEDEEIGALIYDQVMRNKGESK